MTNFVKEIRSQGFELQYLDIGGGLGIDYYRRCVTAHDRLSHSTLYLGMGTRCADVCPLLQGGQTAYTERFD